MPLIIAMVCFGLSRSACSAVAIVRSYSAMVDGS